MHKTLDKHPGRKKKITDLNKYPWKKKITELYKRYTLRNDFQRRLKIILVDRCDLKSWRKVCAGPEPARNEQSHVLGGI